MAEYIPVEWDPDPVAKSGIQQDLLYTLNSSLTGFSPSRNNAEERLRVIARTGIDPGMAEVLHEGTARGEATVKDDEVVDPETAPTLEAIRDRVRAHVAEHFRTHQLTHLVSHILTALGYRCEVSPPGPDGGVDILAGKGPLGLDSPTLVVEVKSEPTAVDVKVLRGLHSAMVQHKADHGLLVAWGGITRPAQREFEQHRTSIRVWDAEVLLDQLFATYEQLAASIHTQIPLLHVWVLDDEG